MAMRLLRWTCNHSGRHAEEEEGEDTPYNKTTEQGENNGENQQAIMVMK